MRTRTLGLLVAMLSLLLAGCVSLPDAGTVSTRPGEEVIVPQADWDKAIARLDHEFDADFADVNFGSQLFNDQSRSPGAVFFQADNVPVNMIANIKDFIRIQT